MKAFLVLSVLFSSLAQAQYWGNHDLVCRNGYYETYFIKTSSPVSISYQPLPSHPEMMNDMDVNLEGVRRGRCLNLCLDIPFINVFEDGKEESVLSLRENEDKVVSASLISPNGTVTTLKCTK